MQIAIRGKLPRGVKLTRALLSAMVHHKAATATDSYPGDDPPGLELLIQRWKNPARGRGKQDWRTGNQSDAWITLRGPLQHANVDL